MLTSDDWEEVGRRWRLAVKRPIERIVHVLQGGLLVGVGLLFLIFGLSPQAQELFRVALEVEQPLNWQVAFSFAATMLLSGVLFFTYRAFLDALDDEGITARSVGYLGLYGVAAAPWLAALVSLLGMNLRLESARAELAGHLQDYQLQHVDMLFQMQSKGTMQLIDTILARFPMACGVVIAGLVLTLGLLWICGAEQGESNSFDASTVVNIATFSIFVVFGLVAALFHLTFVDVYKGIGSLAVGMITTIGLFAIGLIVSWMSRGSGVPISVGAVILVFVYAGGMWISGLVRDSRRGGASAVTEGVAGKEPPTFATAADTWIKSRIQSVSTTPGNPAQQLPLLILSAQGGGMYAAIASSLFMARQQDADPRFNRSVIAVSAVSGGSVGAAFYHALVSSERCQGALQKPAGSDNPVNATRQLEQRIPGLVLGAHLAPVIGNVPADVLRKLVAIFVSTVDRADALAESLSQPCPALNAPYASHWRPDGSGPALVLNTTWMSNGHRVAFAPFGLKAIGDGTLWSFADTYVGLRPLHRGVPFEPTLADALVASARFPGALPPLSIEVGARRHNFGDGGYADASGVTTALELYETVQKLARKRVENKEKVRVRPRLVMLTFDYAPVDPSKEAGTSLDDTVAPLSALLGVRENLSGKAITRALRTVTNEGEEILRVSVNPGDFGMALGWQLSRASYEILSLVMGRPQWCKDLLYEGKNPIIRNSCVARKVLEFVGGK